MIDQIIDKINDANNDEFEIDFDDEFDFDLKRIDNFFDINEFKKIKFKKRSKNVKQKNFVMTRKKKRRRNSSNEIFQISNISKRRSLINEMIKIEIENVINHEINEMNETNETNENENENEKKNKSNTTNFRFYNNNIANETNLKIYNKTTKKKICCTISNFDFVDVNNKRHFVDFH